MKEKVPTFYFVKDTIGETLAAFPPNLVRMLARTGRGRGARNLTHDEVAKRSGLNRSMVREISAMASWEKVAIGDADRFLRGCGVSLSNLWRQRAFLRRSLDPRVTQRPLSYVARGKRAPKPPSAEVLAGAALSWTRKRPKSPSAA